jgi:hypothetical protein
MHIIPAITTPENKSKTDKLSVGNLAFVITKDHAYGHHSTTSYRINKNQGQYNISSGSFSFSYKNPPAVSPPAVPGTITKPVVVSTPFSGSFVMPSITRTTVKKAFSVSGYKAIDDILYLQSVLVDQLETWSDTDEKDKQLNLFKNDLLLNQEYYNLGKPFVGIVTDIHTAQVADSNQFIKLWNLKYFRVLFEDNKHYWFSEIDVRPMYDI